MAQPKSARLVTEAGADLKYVTFSNGTFYLNGVAIFTPGTASSGAPDSTGTPSAGVFTETFTGISNGSPWPAANWTTVINGTNTIDVQNAAGRLTTTGAFDWPGRVYLTGASTTVDRDITFTLDRTNLTGSTFFVFRHDASTGELGGGPEPYNGYYLEVTASTVILRKSVNGSHTDVSTSTTIPGGVYRFRVRYVGTALTVRWWDPTAAEPTTWGWSGTDSSFAVSVNPYFTTYVTDGTKRTVTVDNLTVNS